MRRLMMSLVPLALVLASCGAGSAAPRLRWHDEFNGAADALPSAKSWSFETGGNGWGNNELECYTDAPGNVSTDGKGHLVIAAIRQPGHRCVDGATNDYTSARISTQGKVNARYGRLVVRAKVPAAAGTWSAFWALGKDHDTVGWPRSGEIDVMEQLGRKPTQVLGTVHGPRADGSRWYLTHTHTAKSPLSTAFHTYAVDWTSTSMTWSIDGKHYATVTKAEARRQGVWVFDKPFYLLLNLAIGGGLGGQVDPAATWPQRYLIDYVRVYY